MKLAPKFLIAFAAIAVLSIGLVGFLSYRSARAALKEQAIRDMALISDSLEGHFYSFLDAVKGRAIDFSSDGFIRGKVQEMQAMGPSDPRFRELQKTLGTYLKQQKMPLDTAVKLMLVIGLNGRVIAATSERQINFDELRDSYFLEAKKDAFISDVHFTHHSDEEDNIYIAASAPIKSVSNGALQGVFVNFYSSRELNKILSGEYQIGKGAATGINSRGQTFDIYLVNREKQLITPSIYSTELLTRRVETLPVAECASGRETSGLYNNFMGLEVIGASMCMPSKGWTLLTEIETNKAFAPVLILRGHILEAGLLMLLLSSALAYLVANRITRPLRSLAKITHRIAGGDFCIYTEVHSSDEIGDLAGSFNRMVSEIEESRNAMHTEKSRLEALFNGMADSVIFVDAGDSSTIMNTAALKLLGINSAAVSDYKILNSRDLICRELAELQGLFAGGNFEFYKTDLIYNQRQLELTVYPVRKDNRFLGTVALIQDITERMAAEEALQKSREQLQALIDNINALIFLKDLNGRFILVNQRFAEQMNTTKEALTGKTNYDIFPGESAGAFEEKDRKVLESVAPVEFEEIFFQGDKPHIYISAIFPLLEQAGAPYAICGVMTDITDRKLAEVELKERHEELEAAHEKLKAAQTQILQQDKMASIGQLAAGVAHEINNPVGFIMSNLGTLQKYLNRLSEFIRMQTEAVEKMGVEEVLNKLKEQRQTLKLDYVIEDSGSLITESLDGAERVKRIVQDLKSFSRIDEAEYKMTDLNEGLESTINIVWNELKYKVTLNREYGEIPLTKCNPGQLNQVFMNILVNAAHAIEKQGEITITTGHDNDYIHVAISDTGCGIPEDKINRIFEPFFTTKEVGKGTGLGLSIAYDIVKKHKGDIAVESRLGEGTTFRIKIPVVKG